jgi:hypothetical protein
MAQEDQPLLGLEAKLRQYAARGELTHFSLIPIAGKGPGGVVWCATYSPASKWGSGFGRDADPIAAAMMAFKDVRVPKAPVESDDSVPPVKRRVKAVEGEADFL